MEIFQFVLMVSTELLSATAANSGSLMRGGAKISGFMDSFLHSPEECLQVVFIHDTAAERIITPTTILNTLIQNNSL